MWYKIFIEDEFIRYFGDEKNTFSITENGQTVLAPTFSRFADIVTGVTYAWALPDIRDSSIEHMKKMPDIFRGFAFCRENQSLREETYLAKIWHSIPNEPNGSRYDVPLENLNAEQCAVLLMYPFYSRMGGSFELTFQKDGRLKKYLFALKEKAEEMQKNA